MARSPLSDLPFWPRFLSREEAARYLGVSTSVFDDEVAAGLWPTARRRGSKCGRLTWDRVLLDQWADRDAGLTGSAVPPVPEARPPLPLLGERKRNGTATRGRDQGRPEKAA